MFAYQAIATSVNDQGQIVGLSLTAGRCTHAFLWQNGKMRDLNKLLPSNSGWTLQAAQSISDRGDIVGIGYYKSKFRPFLLTPNQ